MVLPKFCVSEIENQKCYPEKLRQWRDGDFCPANKASLLCLVKEEEKERGKDFFLVKQMKAL